MKRYSEQQQQEDTLKLIEGLEKLRALLLNYDDVLIVHRGTNITEVCNMTLDTTKGPQRVGDVCSRDEIVHILRAFDDNPCTDPQLVAQYALDDYRQTHSATKE